MPTTGLPPPAGDLVIFTTAGPASLAQALATTASVESIYGATRCVVLASERIADRFADVEVVLPQDVLPLKPLASKILEEDELVAFAEPYALARLLMTSGPVLRLAPGAFLVEPPQVLMDTLADASVVLAAPVVVKPTDSLVPNLALRKLDQVVSSTLVGLTGEAGAFLEEWQAAMVDTAFDPDWALPSSITERVLASFVGAPGVEIEGTATLTSWVDYAATKSGAVTAKGLAVVDTDGLWDVIRPQERSGGDMTTAEYRLVDLRVHDSTPLAPIVAVMRSAEITAGEPIIATPFDRLIREIRRTSDPLGIQWGPAASETLEQWAFTRNRLGLTRIADLLWYESSDISRRFPEARSDPDRYRKWSDDSLRYTLGFDPFGKIGQRVGFGSGEACSESVRGLRGALQWRWNTLRNLVPGAAAAGERREAGRAVANPSGRRGIETPSRRMVDRTPAPWGEDPRQLSLIGCFRAESGLGQAARASVAAVRRLDIPFTHIDTSDKYPSRNRVDVGLDRTAHGAVGDVNLIHSNAAELITMKDEVFRHRLGGRFNAAMWFWEAGNLPTWKLAAFDRVNELWVASKYLGEVFGQYRRVPVHVIGLASELPKDRRPDRRALGWRQDEFVFLFVYDALSSKGRKNPEEALRAFIEAFGPKYENVRFVIKVSNLNKLPVDHDRLMEMATVTPAIEIIDAYYSHDQVYDLMAAADVYVSLHAAEGYGLTLLEAMSLGTPVICTGYSGNLDFTNGENSWLVDHALIETTEQSGPYPAGSIWAKPDIENAVGLMRRVVSNPEEVSNKAVAARRDAKEAASLDRYAANLGAQLRRVL